ncbi:uncharacterized protein LOC107883931 [Acyrthosiphon pisum]|uniref:Uncharacterized protein n=1 Tax=Acyrthosiphon pisum TaxID=7029 RepID=A0A8R2D518_ACYPI|nr:uncharacterized protein LOC107883931 [Acyrthosiphon pisum]|eukprot:XP_016660427.1 PREDICTED: uncharacterized protein LOC107883931 [Acyrthosiphon pisum]
MDALSPEDIVLISDKFNETEYQRTAVFSVRKYLVDQYIRFTSIWQLYRFDINLYLKYKIIDISNSFGYLIYDELMLNEIDGVKMTALEAFQKYFKEKFKFS